MRIGLESIVSYLPGEILKVEEYYSYLKPEIDRLPKAEKEILLRSAPQTVHRLKDPSALEHIALSAAQKALAEAGLSAADIDGLLVTQTGGKQFMPLLASYLQLNLGLSRNIIARNINDNNVSVISMINLARIYIQSGLCRRMLVVAASAQIGGKYRFGADLTDPWCMHLGDGAGAAVVSAENLQCEILSFHFETYPVTARKTGTLNADFGPVREPNNRSLCFEAEMDDAYGAYLVPCDPLLRKIAGRESFLSDHLQRAAGKANLQLTDINHVLTEHIGDLLAVWQRDISEKDMDPAVFKNTQKKTGSTGCADVLIDLAEYAKEDVFAKREIIALFVPCTGVQAASLILRWL